MVVVVLKVFAPAAAAARTAETVFKVNRHATNIARDCSEIVSAAMQCDGALVHTANMEKFCPSSRWNIMQLPHSGFSCACAGMPGVWGFQKFSWAERLILRICCMPGKNYVCKAVSFNLSINKEALVCGCWKSRLAIFRDATCEQDNAEKSCFSCKRRPSVGKCSRPWYRCRRCGHWPDRGNSWRRGGCAVHRHRPTHQ